MKSLIGLNNSPTVRDYVHLFFCVPCAIQTLDDRLIKIELPFRIPFLLQSPQFLYPPGLIPIQLLQRYVSIGMIDVGVGSPCLPSLEPYLAGFSAVLGCDGIVFD